jgi:DNA-binding LacI/PurR family transcriptional regulator
MTWQEFKDVAKLADVSWKTVRRFFAGKPMRTGTKSRVVKALKRHSQRKAGK